MCIVIASAGSLSSLQLVSSGACYVEVQLAGTTATEMPILLNERAAISGRVRINADAIDDAIEGAWRALTR